MATSVIYQGKSYQTPGVYVSVDTSALVAPGLGASGIVALIGSATGGVPYTALSGRTSINTYSSVTALAQAFPGGDLLEAANMTFAASQDPAINGGAQFVVPLKANPATQAAVTLAGAGGPAITLTALQYGFAGNGISVQAAPGSTSGVKLTLTNGTVTEVADNLGREPVGSLSFTPQGTGWQTMSGGVTGGALAAQGSLGTPGRSSDLLATTLSATSAISITANPADAAKTLTLYGLDGNGAGQTEVVTLVNGAQSSAKTYSRLLGVQLSSAAQDVRLADNQGVTLAELDNDATSLGLYLGQNLTLSGAPATLSASVAGEVAVVAGLDPSGNPVIVAITLGSAPQGTPALSKIVAIALGGVNPTHTVTVEGFVVAIPASTTTTVSQAAGAFQAIPGFKFSVNPTDAATPIAQLDPQTDVDLVAGPLSLVSDIRAAVDWAAQNSQLVSIEAAPGSVGLPTPTSAPVGLTGGVESPATAADYAKCLALLQQVRVNTVVALSSDPAVAHAVDAHCALMCGTGQSERDAIVGVMNSALTDVPTLVQFTSAASNLNSRHTRAVGAGGQPLQLAERAH